MMTCACCGGSLVKATKQPGPHAACGTCGHRSRHADPAERASYYSGLEGRNTGPAERRERRLRDRMATLANLLRDGLRVVEIGCAEGELGARAKALARIVYDGVEPSRDAAAAAKVLDRVSSAALPAGGGECYDLLLAFHVLEHIPDADAAVAAWRDLLKPEGLAVIEVPRGAGHPLLSWDANPEHLHQFTAASLATLFQRHGLETISLTSGHFESPVYPDCLRLVARVAREDTARRGALLQRFRARFPGSFAIYGLGGDFRNYVSPLLDDLAVAALIDSDAGRHGERIGAHVVEPFDRTRHAGLPVLVATLRHHPEIAKQLAAQGVPPMAIVALEEIYGGTS